MTRLPSLVTSAIFSLVLSGAPLVQNASAQVLSGSKAPIVSSPPSVGNGIANGVVKPSGSPSVSNGVANGVVKQSGAPSVDNGVANGVAKSSTVQQ